jgi:hypothetical protein
VEPRLALHSMERSVARSSCGHDGARGFQVSVTMRPRRSASPSGERHPSVSWLI